MTRHLVRELTPDGIAYAKRFLAEAREGRAIDVPDDLLTDDRYAKPTATECFIEKRKFHTRRDAGEYLSIALDALGIGYVDGNYPLWSWLGIFFFEILVDHNDDGRFVMGRLPDQAFVINKDPKHTADIVFNRLMLAWQAHKSHGDEYASWMLDQPVLYVPRIVDQLSRSRTRFSSNGIVKLIGILYIDATTGKVKSQAGGDKTIGGIRRLNDVLDQLYMTYDVYGMRAEQLLALLPEEFQRFNSAAGSARRR